MFNLLVHITFIIVFSLSGIFRRNPKASKKDASSSKLNGKIDGLDANKDSASTNEVKVDEEGFVIRDPSTYESLNKKEDKFYSDSDSDSDQEGNRKPIKVVIKPINGSSSNNFRSGSIAELQRTVQGLSISPSITSGVR